MFISFLFCIRISPDSNMRTVTVIEAIALDALTSIKYIVRKRLIWDKYSTFANREETHSGA